MNSESFEIKGLNKSSIAVLAQIILRTFRNPPRQMSITTNPHNIANFFSKVILSFQQMIWAQPDIRTLKTKGSLTHTWHPRTKIILKWDHRQM